MITNLGSGDRHLRCGYPGQLENPIPITTLAASFEVNGAI